MRELIEDTHEAVGDRCAVAVRLAIDELHGEQGITSQGDGREIIEYLADLPDLWDIALGGGLGNDSRSSRFSAEGYQEQYAGFVKGLTSKPVVSVGRFTSPDTMLSQIKRGVQDFIGAARPSIADPFLPNKIDQGREDEIRECIGCNICRSANNEGVSCAAHKTPQWVKSGGVAGTLKNPHPAPGCQRIGRRWWPCWLRGNPGTGAARLPGDPRRSQRCTRRPGNQ